MGLVHGNRGKCAQVCRLPYTLLTNNETVLDKGYLLSPKDLCGLDFIPELIEAGVTSFKIEGRMKSPEYVAIVTKIYRKYIDLALSNEEYIIDEEDKKALIQVFNRGGFSSGHLEKNANTELIFKEKPGNMGVYIGNVSGYNSNKGYITVNLNNKICLGDTVSVEHENSKYRVSELMENKDNILEANDGMVVKLGRIKGNIKPGDKVFKLEDKKLFLQAKSSFSKGEHIQTNLACTIKIEKGKPISVTVFSGNGKSFEIFSKIIPTEAISAPITKERIITQFSKTGSTPFQFTKFNIILEDNLYVNIADINELRRNCIAKLEENILQNTKKQFSKKAPCLYMQKKELVKNKKISLLLNELDINTNYSLLDNVDSIYIPLKYFANCRYSNILKSLSLAHPMYIYMPNIIKANYKNLFANNIDTALDTYDIKGFVLSNISNFELLKPYKGKYSFIGNYTLNVFNNNSIKYLNNLGITKQTISCELTKANIEDICNNCNLPTELIVYGNIPIMTSGYCFLGRTNKCYPDCNAYCNQNNTYYLRDKMGFDFRVVPDNIQTVTTLYNSKITSIDFTDFNVDSVRIDILDENILEINNIINTVKQGNRLAGKNYTNGNLYREV